VSPWLRSRITVWLSPHALVAAREPGAFGRGRARELHEEPLAPRPSLRDWSACASALEAHLRASGWTGAAVSISLSDHFARYACLAWRAGLRSGNDWEAYALHEFERRYGIKSGHVIRIAPSAPASARVAVAVDEALLARLREVIVASGSRLASVEANACRVANRFRRTLGRSGRLVVAEPQRLTCFTAVDDRWADVQSVRASGSDAWASLALQARLHSRVGAGREKLLTWGVATAAADAGGLDVPTPLAPPASTPRMCTSLGLL
jgi:hypothetical protein